MQTINEQHHRTLVMLDEDPALARRQVEEAMADKRNLSVRVFTPGQVIRHSDRAYTVQADGSWRRNR